MYYKIIRATKFDIQLKQICSSYQRMSLYDEAIDWYLSRDPKREFDLNNGFYLWVTDSLPSKDFPSLRILYKVDDEKKCVTLLSMQVIY